MEAAGRILLEMFRERGCPNGVRPRELGQFCARAWTDAGRPTEPEAVRKVFLDAWRALHMKEKSNAH